MGVDQSGSDDGSYGSEEVGTLAIQAMIESFRQEVTAALDMVKEVQEAAVGRMVAPLPPGRAEGESGGREWPAAGRGEAGVQSERGTVTSAQQGLGGRRLEIPSGRPAANRRRHYMDSTRRKLSIYTRVYLPLPDLMGVQKVSHVGTYFRWLYEAELFVFFFLRLSRVL